MTSVAGLGTCVRSKHQEEHVSNNAGPRGTRQGAKKAACMPQKTKHWPTLAAAAGLPDKHPRAQTPTQTSPLKKRGRIGGVLYTRPRAGDVAGDPAATCVNRGRMVLNTAESLRLLYCAGLHGFNQKLPERGVASFAPDLRKCSFTSSCARG